MSQGQGKGQGKINNSSNDYGTPIPCTKGTREKVDSLRKDWNEQESYHVGYDKVLLELMQGYEFFETISDNYSNEQLTALIQGDADVVVKGKGQGNGENKVESVKSEEQDQ